MSNLKKKDTFCPLAWMQVCIHTNGLQKVCCHSNTPHSIVNSEGQPSSFQNASDMIDPLNNPGLKEIRKNLLKGNIPTVCKSCFELEEKTGHSPRTEHIELYKEHIPHLIDNTNDDGTLMEPKVIHLDISMGNICNLACRMCNPYYSNKIEAIWESKNILFNREAQKEVSKFSKSKKIIPSFIGETKKICFQGGEPLLAKGHLEFLTGLIESQKCKSIEIEYNTNLTVLNDETIKMWGEFKKVTLFISFDGVGKVQEFIRRPIDWDRFESNLNRLKNLNNVETKLITVVQAYNLGNLIEIMRFARKYYNQAKLPDFIFLQAPEFLAASALERDYLEEVKEELYKELDVYSQDDASLKSLKIFLDNLKPNKKHLLDFHLYNEKLDKDEELKWNDIKSIMKKSR